MTPPFFGLALLGFLAFSQDRFDRCPILSHLPLRNVLVRIWGNLFTGGTFRQVYIADIHGIIDLKGNALPLISFI